MLVNAAGRMLGGEYVCACPASFALRHSVTHIMPSKRWNWIVRLLLVLLVGIGIVRMFGSARPSHLGVQNGQLAACPDKPNCVSTQATDDTHRIEPLAFSSGQAEMERVVRDALGGFPRTKIVTDADGYFHAECTSLICRYVDDLEIWIDGKERLIHARSASRVGYSDLGVNRARVEKLFEMLGAQ